MPYKIGVGLDVPLVDLDDIIPQPATVGLQYARRTFAASGVVVDELPFVEFEFSTLDSPTQYVALLTQFGLASATTADVTVYVQNENYVWTRYNGKAVKPLVGSDGARNNFFLRGFTILVKNLRTPS